MAVSIGTRLGPYEILGLIGAGGMGEVYKARDTRLDRVVAIKVLAAQAVAVPEARLRFEREARAVSSLHHPHICTLHDIGQQDGIDYFVMEYLAGESLAQRIKRGALPLDETLKCAIEVADALDRAHRQHVIHRDLKPGNIMLTKDGAKVLDFGLAKIREQAVDARAGAGSNVQTLTAPLTTKGSIMGTLPYMAPEQLEGREADARTDVFAMGAVLYEMATRRRAFEGESQASVIAAILERNPPPVSSLQTNAPAELDRVITICLAKDPENRWQSARDLVLQLQSIASKDLRPAQTKQPRRFGNRERIAWIFSAILLAALVLTVLYYRGNHETFPATEFSVSLPEDASGFQEGSSVSVSPDGRFMALRAVGQDGHTHLWLRAMDSTAVHVLPGTEGTSLPIWSPDSGSFVVYSGEKLTKIGLGGGPPVVLLESAEPLPTPRGSWNRNGDILFAKRGCNCIWRVSEKGDSAGAVTALNSARQERSHDAPYFLPDGRRFLYTVQSARPDYDGIYLGSLGQKEGRLLIAGASDGLYTRPRGSSHGYILFARELVLMAQAFDPGREQLSGEPFTIGRLSYVHAFSASDNGVVGYRSGTSQSILTWMDRQGHALDRVSEPGDYRHISISPDGTTLAVTRNETTGIGSSIWLIDLSRRAPVRLPSGGAWNWLPVWSADGKRIAYSSYREARMNLLERASTGAGKEQLLLASPFDKYLWSSSPDGHYLAYSVTDPVTRQDLWILPLFGDRKPFVFLQTKFDETHAAFSPDAHWLAYVSDDSGKPEVYVRRFEGGAAEGRVWRISTSGGSHPRWRRDGKELFYLASDRKLMSVGVTLAPDFAAGAPQALFQTRLGLRFYLMPYDVAANGQKFLLSAPAEEAQSGAITVIVNWNPSQPPRQ